jgi:hypothetical protein
MAFRSTPKVVFILTMAIVCSGCSFVNMTKGYLGPERAPRELAVIRTTEDRIPPNSVVFLSKHVILHEAHGELCGSKACVADTSRALLLPGRYNFTVQYRELTVSYGGPGLIILAVNIAEEKANKLRKKHVVSFEVEAGRTYHLHYSEQDSLFVVSSGRYFAEPHSALASLIPPADAEPCLTRDLDPSAFCHLVEPQMAGNDPA